MSIHLTKIWWDLNKHKLVEKAIPEAEIYKREWVGLTDDDIAQAMFRADAIITGPMQFRFASEIEAELRKKNT